MKTCRDMSEPEFSSPRGRSVRQASWGTVTNFHFSIFFVTQKERPNDKKSMKKALHGAAPKRNNKELKKLN